MKFCFIFAIISLTFCLKKENLFKTFKSIQNSEINKKEKGSISSFQSKDIIFDDPSLKIDAKDIFGYNIFKCKQPQTNNCIYYCRYNPYMDLCRYNCYRTFC